MRLLIVEDSHRLRESLTDGLRAGGYAVDSAGDGRAGLAHARNVEYDAIILDLMLPELDGLSLLRDIRARGQRTPVLVLSAKDRVEHRVEALRLGADDYLTKPFVLDELMARLEALTRRARGVAGNIVRVGAIELDLGAKRFSARGRAIDLTPREHAILEHLVLQAGRVVSRAELEEHVYAADKQVWSNAIDSGIAAIRRKLGEQGVADPIETRRGLGYFIARASGVGGSGA